MNVPLRKGDLDVGVGEAPVDLGVKLGDRRLGIVGGASNPYREIEDTASIADQDSNSTPGGGSSMKTIAIVGFCVLLTVPVAAEVPYWIPVEGCEIVRGGDLSGIEYHTAGPALSVSVTFDHEFFRTDRYTWVTDTQLGLWEQQYSDSEASAYRFDPPLIVLDLPLTTGKTWTSESVRQRWDGDSVPLTFTLNSVVLGPLTVNTVVGALDVIEVLQTTYVEGLGGRNDRLYLHEQLGNVYELIDTADCGMVATQTRTWSGVKGLYR